MYVFTKSSFLDSCNIWQIMLISAALCGERNHIAIILMDTQILIWITISGSDYFCVRGRPVSFFQGWQWFWFLVMKETNNWHLELINMCSKNKNLSIKVLNNQWWNRTMWGLLKYNFEVLHLSIYKCSPLKVPVSLDGALTGPWRCPYWSMTGLRSLTMT